MFINSYGASLFVMAIKTYLLDSETNFLYAYAMDDKKVVGILQFTFKDGFLKSHGIKVNTQYQKQGIASQLWAMVIAHFKPECVDTNPSTKAGIALVEKLKNDYPEIDWMY